MVGGWGNRMDGQTTCNKKKRDGLLFRWTSSRGQMLVQDELLGPVGQKCKDYPQRIMVFTHALMHVAENMLDDATESDWECRELAIKVLRHVANSDGGREVVVGMKETIGGTGAKRIEQMRSLDRQNSNASETERADEELYLWKLLTDELEA